MKFPQSTPFFFGAKEPNTNTPDQDTGLRPIIDYHYLNSWTVRDQGPLPLLCNIHQAPRVQEAKYHMVMDIRWGFDNICIKEGDEWKAAFTTKFGLFKPTVMFFSLCNSPVSFQHMINARFKIVLDSGFVFIYMDDILIVGCTLEELHHWTHEVLKLLKKYGLSCKPVKCQFEKESVKYLGNILSQGKIAVNLKKTTSVQAWPTPTCLKDIESFLGTMNFW